MVENSIIELGKAASFPLIFNHLNWNPSLLNYQIQGFKGSSLEQAGKNRWSTNSNKNLNRQILIKEWRSRSETKIHLVFQLVVSDERSLTTRRNQKKIQNNWFCVFEVLANYSKLNFLRQNKGSPQLRWPVPDAL